ncbi:hypothetical protein OAQ60_02615 [Methylophilaceae bacterium]|nr:hypothetical protein [Methylophilaceae bacterium]
MGFFSSLFGSPVDKVASEIHLNTERVSIFMETFQKVTEYDDFTFEYLYTTSELITQDDKYGSVIYIKIDSKVHKNVAALPVDSKEIQDAIDKHQKEFKRRIDMALPETKEITRWIYFNLATMFRTA